MMKYLIIWNHKKKYDKDIKENIIKHPELHINQIISLFKIVYPKRLEAKTEMNRKKKILGKKQKIINWMKIID